jgi:hypothetical protein
MMVLANSQVSAPVQNLAFRRDALAHTACFEKPIEEITFQSRDFASSKRCFVGLPVWLPCKNQLNAHSLASYLAWQLHYNRPIASSARVECDSVGRNEAIDSR